MEIKLLLPAMFLNNRNVHQDCNSDRSVGTGFDTTTAATSRRKTIGNCNIIKGLAMLGLYEFP